MRRILSLWLPRFVTDRLRARLAPDGAAERRGNGLAAIARRPSPLPPPAHALRASDSVEPAKPAVGGGKGNNSPPPLRGRDRVGGAHLHADRELSPLVTAVAVAGRAVIVAVDDRAAAAGLAPGMPVADARAILPRLRVHPADLAGDTAALDRLAEWSTRYTPWTAIDGGDGLWLDLTGCAHLFDGERAVLQDLIARLARLGHGARAAIAETAGAAWAAARFVDDSAGTGVIVPTGGARDSLAPLPVAALRLPPAMAGELQRLGLRRIGDLLPMPRAALARRFGVILAERLDQALGHGAESLSPRRAIVSHQARLALAEPVVEAGAIAAGLRRLLAPLCRQLEGDRLGARRLELAVHGVDGGVQRIAIGLARPNRDPAALERLLAMHIERIDPGFGIEVMRLSALRVEPLDALQIVMREAREANGGAFDLVPLVDGLGNRLGFGSLRRFMPQASHVPERAVRAAAALAMEKTPDGWPSLPPRPLRLFRPPHPIEAMALLPDHPPVFFRWHARLHRVAHAEGPERLEPEWWRPEDDVAGARDYFRVEDEDGRRFWLYRDGAPPAGGRWFLHGLFD